MSNEENKQTAFQHIYCDFGNSFLKFARETPQGLSKNIVRITNDDFRPSKDLGGIKRLLTDKPIIWHVGSVNSRAERILKEFVGSQRKEDRVRIYLLNHMRIETTVDRPNSIGKDRLMASIAANELKSPKKAAIIIDAGTAVTVDAIDENGVFLGGVIFPGLQTAFKSLADHTDALPSLTINRNIWQTDYLAGQRILGKNTADAIKSGVVWTNILGTIELAKRLQKQLSTKEVFLTGGLGGLIHDLEKKWNLRPNLVLEGMRITAQANPDFIDDSQKTFDWFG